MSEVTEAVITVETDCCEQYRPITDVDSPVDRDGLVLVTQCRAGFGCQS